MSLQPWQPGNTTSIQVLEINRRQIDLDWDASDVCSSFWRFYVNSRDGAGLLFDEGRFYPLQAKRIYLVPAWVRFTCQNTTQIDHFYIHFDLAGLPGILIRQLFPQPIMLDSSREMVLMLRKFQAQPWLNTSESMATTCRITALLNLAMAQAWEGLTADQNQMGQRHLQGSHQLTMVLQFIEEQLARPMQNTQLAQLCHLSRDHFVRRFAQEIGQTPAQYIRERRVARAAQLLCFGQESIDQIAQQCGFADRFHFSRVFAQIMGSPPAAYRQGKRV
jgi:AraC-like DNA-binding protein